MNSTEYCALLGAGPCALPPEAVKPCRHAIHAVLDVRDRQRQRDLRLQCRQQGAALELAPRLLALRQALAGREGGVGSEADYHKVIDDSAG